MSGDSTGAWLLADALVKEVPAEVSGKRNDLEPSSDVTTRLAQIADRLAEDGIETPAGGTYTAASLRDLRLTAMGWPTATRLREAAFRTHQEAGTTDEGRREVLRVLCLAARNLDWSKPPMNHRDVDEAEWQLAMASIQRKVHSGMRYPVSANDYRRALNRRPNVPPSSTPEDQATVIDAIEGLQKANESFDRVVRILSREGLHLGDSREALEGQLQRLQVTLGALLELVAGGGITDAALQRLTEHEA